MVSNWARHGPGTGSTLWDCGPWPGVLANITGEGWSHGGVSCHCDYSVCGKMLSTDIHTWGKQLWSVLRSCKDAGLFESQYYLWPEITLFFCENLPASICCRVWDGLPWVRPRRHLSLPTSSQVGWLQVGCRGWCVGLQARSARHNEEHRFSWAMPCPGLSSHGSPQVMSD